MGLALACIMVILALESSNAMLGARLSTRVFEDIRVDLHRSFSAADWSLQAEEADGHLQELLITNATMAAQSVLVASTALAALISAVVLLTAALVTSALATLAVGVTAMALFLSIRPMAIRGRRLSGEMAEANIDLIAKINERVDLAQDILTANVEETVAERYERSVKRASSLFRRRNSISRLSPALFRDLGMVLVLLALGIVYSLDLAEVGSLATAVLIFVRVLTYLQSLQQANHQLHDYLPWTERIWEKQAEYKAARLDTSGAELARVEQIRFHDVGYSYEAGHQVLQQVSFTIEPGETIGIVGPSGGGKSTLVQLLLRLRVPESGSYRINDVDADTFSLDSWYRRVAFVPQEPRTLTGTVAENIAFFRVAPNDEVVRNAAKLAHLHDEIEQMPDGYDTQVGERGGHLSGGQRQRLCIARALLTEPDLLVLDEPTSALDPISEARVQQTLTDLSGRVTMIIVAHRMSTISRCDRVLVFEQGRLTAVGPPREVEEANDYFRDSRRLSRL
jgi:ABC-type multidrug transport system fused ATPase/permease subunit